jgi:hypothetical protein
VDKNVDRKKLFKLAHMVLNIKPDKYEEPRKAKEDQPLSSNLSNADDYHEEKQQRSF